MTPNQVTKANAYLPRTIEPVVQTVSRLFKVVLLTGPRQCGKSTCLGHLAQQAGNRAHLSLDYPDLVAEVKAAPSQFFTHHPTPVLIEELQYAPDIFRLIKAEVDSKPDKGMVWATGSHKFELMKGVSESLAGRLIPLDLLPMSIYERNGLGLLQKPYVPTANPAAHLGDVDHETIWSTIWQGAWPDVINAPDADRDAFFHALLSTSLLRDIWQSVGEARHMAFLKFLALLAARTGQELRLGALADEVGASVHLIKKWLSLAERIGLIYLLRPYFANTNRQLVRSPRVYFIDTGLAAHLSRIPNPEALKNHPNAGAFFETFVITEILKSWVHNGKFADFYFYSDSKSRAEIDLLIRHDGKLHPVEIQASSHPTSQAIKNFKVLDDLPEPVGHGAVICTTSRTYDLSDTCTAHSISSI